MSTAPTAASRGGAGAATPVDRNRILDAAATLFSELGYRGANLARVADLLSVTRQALYHHFATKDAILYALIARTVSIFEVQVLGIEDESPGATFAAMLGEHAHICAAHVTLVRISTTEDRELPEHLLKEIQQRRRDYHRAFVTAYRAGMDSGELRTSTDVSATVSFALGACQSMVTWYRPSGRQKPRAMAEMIASTICDGLVVDPALRSSRQPG